MTYSARSSSHRWKGTARTFAGTVALLLALGVQASAAAYRKPAPAIAPSLDTGILAPGTFQWLVEDPVPGPFYLIVSLEKQMVHVYRGDTLIGMASVSTGKRGHTTPAGDFPILQKREFHRSNIYSNAPMPFMQRLTWDGIALHAGHNPGYPASHGCIRLPMAFARKLFGMTQIGTLVSITGARLAPTLKLDPLVLADPDATVLAFSMSPTPMKPHWAMPIDRGEARLPLDPGVFDFLIVRGDRR